MFIKWSCVFTLFMYLSNYVTCDFIRDATSFENMQQRSLYRFKLIFPARLCYGISFYFICDFLKSKKEPDSRLGLGTNTDNCPSACRHLFSFFFFFFSLILKIRRIFLHQRLRNKGSWPRNKVDLFSLLHKFSHLSNAGPETPGGGGRTRFLGFEEKRKREEVKAEP